MPTKTLLLVRHAEYDAPADGAPAPNGMPLNAAGRARAKALARLVGSAGVTTILASDTARAQQTAEPLAAALKLPIRTYSAPDTPALLRQALADTAGALVLIVGHSNTIPAALKALGAPIAETLLQGHEDLLVATVTGPGAASVVRLKYGP